MTDNKNDKTIDASATIAVPVKPAEGQYNRYNMALPQSFSIYNDEGSILYRGEVEQMANQLRAEIFGEEAKREEQAEAPVEEKKKKGVKKYDKKRAFFLVLPLILAAVLLAIYAVSVFATPATEYISIYNVTIADKTPIAALDPAVGFLANKFDFAISGIPTEFIKFFPVMEGEATYAAAGYALTIATVVYALFALIVLIVSIVGLAGKKGEDGFYKKARLGFLSIVMFVCALIVAVGGVLMSGGAAKDLLGFVTGEYAVSFGYGLIAMLAIPVVTFVCSCVAYRRVK